MRIKWEHMRHLAKRSHLCPLVLTLVQRCRNFWQLTLSNKDKQGPALEVCRQTRIHSFISQTSMAHLLCAEAFAGGGERYNNEHSRHGPGAPYVQPWEGDTLIQWSHKEGIVTNGDKQHRGQRRELRMRRLCCVQSRRSLP